MKTTLLLLLLVGPTVLPGGSATAQSPRPATGQEFRGVEGQLASLESHEPVVISGMAELEGADPALVAWVRDFPNIEWYLENGYVQLWTFSDKSVRQLLQISNSPRLDASFTETWSALITAGGEVVDTIRFTGKCDSKILGVFDVDRDGAIELEVWQCAYGEESPEMHELLEWNGERLVPFYWTLPSLEGRGWTAPPGV